MGVSIECSMVDQLLQIYWKLFISLSVNNLCGSTLTSFPKLERCLDPWTIPRKIFRKPLLSISCLVSTKVVLRLWITNLALTEMSDSGQILNILLYSKLFFFLDKFFQHAQAFSFLFISAMIPEEFPCLSLSSSLSVCLWVSLSIPHLFSHFWFLQPVRMNYLSGMMVHTFNLNIQEDRGQITVSSRPTWSTHWGQIQPRLHGMMLSQRKIIFSHIWKWIK